MCFDDYKVCEKPIDLSDPVVQLPKRLSETERGAVESAKAAAVEAQGHAVACKGHAARVLEISQTIQPGPNGKSLADEAKLETEDAKVAAQLTEDALKKAIVAGDATPLAGEYVEMAKSAVQQAKDAYALAKSLLDGIYELGYAPYWTGPRACLARFSPKQSGDDQDSFYCGHIVWGCDDVPEKYHPFVQLSALTSDPEGGVVDIVPLSTDTQEVNYYVNPLEERWHCGLLKLPSFLDHAQCDSYRPGVDAPADMCGHFLAWITVAGDKLEDAWGKSIEFELSVRSRATGLASAVTLTIYFVQNEVDMVKPYIDADMVVIE